MIQHIAFIMDGNRRWAKGRGLAGIHGHREGARNIETVVNFCLEKNIPVLSLYTFSLENFKRPKSECSFLFSLMANQAEKALEQMKEQKVKVSFVGERSLFPKEIVSVCEKMERETASFSRLHLNFLFCYGARQEVVNGVKRIAEKVKNGELAQEDISDELLHDHLWTGGLPDPDLIVRTGGQQRLSNFLLYQAAYSEFAFLDCFWPDLNRGHLDSLYESYMNRQRNFGG